MYIVQRNLGDEKLKMRKQTQRVKMLNTIKLDGKAE